MDGHAASGVRLTGSPTRGAVGRPAPCFFLGGPVSVGIHTRADLSVGVAARLAPGLRRAPAFDVTGATARRGISAQGVPLFSAAARAPGALARALAPWGTPSPALLSTMGVRVVVYAETAVARVGGLAAAGLLLCEARRRELQDHDDDVR